MEFSIVIWSVIIYGACKLYYIVKTPKESTIEQEPISSWDTFTLPDYNMISPEEFNYRSPVKLCIFSVLFPKTRGIVSGNTTLYEQVNSKLVVEISRLLV